MRAKITVLDLKLRSLRCKFKFFNSAKPPFSGGSWWAKISTLNLFSNTSRFLYVPCSVGAFIGVSVESALWKSRPGFYILCHDSEFKILTGLFKSPNPNPSLSAPKFGVLCAPERPPSRQNPIIFFYRASGDFLVFLFFFCVSNFEA